tara:strand:- start:6080 stop:6331 length:252 start_codon:yes stop_codon:yes gene_type:complete
MNVMNVDNIPKHVKAIIQDRTLTMSQKMNMFMAFMPSLPSDPKAEIVYRNNIELGKTIKQLIDEKKIKFGKFDKNFKLSVIKL